MLKKVSNKASKKKTKIFSVLVTLAVVSILFLAGPAKAITLSLTPSVESATGGDEISFLAKVDLHVNDIIPLRNFTITISNGDSCTFDLNGNKIEGACNSSFVNITPITTKTNWTDSSGYGYGYGYNVSGGIYNIINKSFGYGYQAVFGYGYDAFSNSTTGTAEFVYNITWTTPDATANYTALFSANADGTIYRTKSASLVIQVTASETADDTTPSTSGRTSYTIGIDELSEGITKELRVGDILRIEIKGEGHTVRITELTATTATVRVESTPQTKTLSIGEEWKVDVDGDEMYYDLSIKLNSIARNKANLTVKSISELIEEVKPISEEKKTDDEPTREDVDLPTEVSVSKTNFWLSVLVLIILVIVVWIIFTKKKKRRVIGRRIARRR